MICRLKYLSENKKVILFLFFFIFGLSFYTNLSFFIKDPEKRALFPPFKKGVNANENLILGYENFSIAEAISSGKGFSNPFKVDTGPTAWMPPVYPFLLAILLKILKSKLLVGIAILIMKNFVLVFTGILVYQTAKKTLVHMKSIYALLVYGLWLISFFWWFFQKTQDVWIILLFVDIILLLSLYLMSNPTSKKILIIWGLIGGFATLTNPILAIVWLAISVYEMRKLDKKMLFYSFIIFLSIISAWTLRNFLVFNQIIFVKSNLYYDAYQANYVNEKGVLDQPFFEDHPYRTAKLPSVTTYERLGEAEFSKLYRKKLLQSLVDNPHEYLKKAANRLLAVTLIYHPYNPRIESNFQTWTSIMHPLPFIFLLCLLFFGKNKQPIMWISILAYVFFLTPYVLISYYIRYSFPLAPISVLFICWGLDSLYGRAKQTFSPRIN